MDFSDIEDLLKPSLNTTDDLKMVPYRFGFDYTDRGFIRRNVGKIIPSGGMLSDFCEGDECTAKVLFMRAGMVLAKYGLPENAADYILRKDGVNENAFKHLAYLSADSTIELIEEGMNLDNDECEPWLIVVLGFLASQWLDENTIYKLMYYSDAMFSPNRLLSTIDQRGDQWEMLLDNKTFTVARNYQFHSFEGRTKKAEKILERFHFYGGNSEFYQSLQFHSFLPPITTYALVSKFMTSQVKEEKKIASLLFGLYLTDQSLENALTALK